MTVDERDSVVRADPASEPGALGDADDHLRLTVALGHLARARGADLATANASIEAPQWSTRLDALSRLLTDPSMRGVVFHDLDALYVPQVEGPARWSDDAFRRERRDLFELLSEVARSAGWVLVRPWPTPEAAAYLGPGRNSGCAAESARMRDALLRNRVLTEDEYNETVEVAKELGRDVAHHLVVRADESLRADAREAALRLSLLRVEQPYNGVAGPFTLVDPDAPADGTPFDTLSAPGVRTLIDSGLLHEIGGIIRMPRVVRTFYRTLAERTGDIDARAEHAWLAQRPTVQGEAEPAIERHFHAISADDADLALKTASFYVQDLRLLAARIGRRGGVHNCLKAARLFEHITKHDPEDAYAWEYYGLNMARCNPRSKAPDLRDRVLGAYERAASLDPDNPLFAGRLDGWKARWGHPDVYNRFRHQVYALTPHTKAASWYAHQVLREWQFAGHLEPIGQARQDFGASRIAAWMEKQVA